MRFVEMSLTDSIHFPVTTNIPTSRRPTTLPLKNQGLRKQNQFAVGNPVATVESSPLEVI